MFKVALVTAGEADVPSWVRDKLAENDIRLEARPCKDTDDFVRFAADADLVWTFGANHVITPDSLRALERCGAILRGGSGTDALPVSAATELGIVVANTPEALAEEVAEHALALMLAVNRKIVLQDRAVRRNCWDPDQEAGQPRHLLRGRTLGLIGFGNIARAFWAGVRGFEMSLLVYDPIVKPAEVEALGGKVVTLAELLAHADYLSLHCPLTESTHHLIDAHALQLMKPAAVLVNTARGAIIDEDALALALMRHDIAGAGLDVLEQEPPASDNPLLKLDNVIITPHIAPYSDDFKENMWRHSVAAIRHLADHRWPPSCVNPNVVPRWTTLR